MRPLWIRTPRSYHPSNVCRRQLSEKQAVNTNSAHLQKSIPTASEHVVSSTLKEQQTKQSRLDRLLKRTPKSLHRHVAAIRSAPVTHVSAFLILHEITAVVPLFALAGAFHYYEWLPSYFSEGAWIVGGVEMFGRYFRRKGWITSDQEHEAESLAQHGEAGSVERKGNTEISRWWDRGEGGVRVVVEFATAYAIVKALLIPRLMLSAWGAPWFARWAVVPVVSRFGQLFRRSRASPTKTN